MHIILVSNRLATAKTFVITPRFVLAAVTVFLAMMFATSALFSWLSVQFRLPFLEHMVLSVHKQEVERSDAYMRDNLNAMAARLGQMQAQLLRLDSLGERVSSLAGVKPEDKPIDFRGGQGGPLLLAQPQTPVEFGQALDRLSRHVEYRLDALSAMESQLLDEKVRRSLLPTITPIQGNYVGSGFGWRVDPIVGAGAMHEGIDFVADVGTPVIAAAGGVVVVAENHPQYGNLIEIDHGNDFSTRYAHLSKLVVKDGQFVKRGQHLGLSGNTGRSTGPHLHFEVRYKGVAQNPSRFLQQGGQLAQASRGRR
ncbi:M23 family metallopeptidase [Azospira restricta]|uniref:M23 family metallopeptidase n=1 Tax=Azospira restricta TaxID=404405 RepID=A0A974SNV8_9RHOO|nr:M23 family metallopeptidase [Azospira restricta]QRJ63721.1 M23 family metallopeptidase [Azospira restricta]